ncbi:hypothetical protein [Sorangium sp. So ce117]|uniref:hypothetical protein n=1 Tax=Sorangium sp. So ce117 TaxID=3133277 RepID=UPI003F6277A7
MTALLLHVEPPREDRALAHAGSARDEQPTARRARAIDVVIDGGEHVLSTEEVLVAVALDAEVDDVSRHGAVYLTDDLLVVASSAERRRISPYSVVSEFTSQVREIVARKDHIRTAPLLHGIASRSAHQSDPPTSGSLRGGLGSGLRFGRRHVAPALAAANSDRTDDLSAN